MRQSKTSSFKPAWWPLFAKEKAIVGHESVLGWLDDRRTSAMTPEQFYNHQTQVKGLTRGF